MTERRPTLTDPAALEALSHPVRLAVMEYLMSSGPATASVCARAVGDSASNCSYHLRMLERVGLVESIESEDARERPWRARLTGFSTDGGDPAAEAAVMTSVQLNQRKLREFLARRASLPAAWAEAATVWHFVLRLDADELRALSDRIDALVRPYLAATRTDAPSGAALVRGSFVGYPDDVDPAPSAAHRPSSDR